jgi:hypothetical protein
MANTAICCLLLWVPQNTQIHHKKATGSCQIVALANTLSSEKTNIYPASSWGALDGGE